MAPSKYQRQPRDNPGRLRPTKIIYSLYQAAHHLVTMKAAQNDPAYPVFMSKVNELDRFFKVAGAQDDPEFTKSMKETNRLWRELQIENQVAHYKRMVDFYKGALSSCKLSEADMRSHLQTAKLWAQKNYKRKYKDSEFKQVLDMALTHVDRPRQGEDLNIIDRPRQGDKLVSVPVSVRPSQGNSTTNGEWVTPRPNKRKAAESPEVSPSQNHSQKTLRPSPSTMAPEQTSPAGEIDFGQGSRFRPLEQLPEPPTPTSVAGSRGDKRKKEGNLSPTSPSTPKRSRQEKRGSDGSSPTLPVPKGHRQSADEILTSPPASPRVQTTPEDLSAAPTPSKDPRVVPTSSDGPSISPPVEPRPTPAGTTPGATTRSQASTTPPRWKKIPFKTSQKVTCFMSLGNIKGKNITNHWKLPRLTKSTVAIGTSNFRRIENIDRDDVEVFSFSGMKLGQLAKVLDDYQYGPTSRYPGIQPTNVILMAGLNDMKLSKITNKTNISRVYSAARRQFPESKISFCLVPIMKGKFSTSDYATIADLNNEIEIFCRNHTKVQYIPRIAIKEFDVDPADPIHWTPECADKTIKHILKHLN